MPTPLSDVCVLPTFTLLETAKVIERGMHRTAVVVEDFTSYKVLGIVSEGDILRALIRGTDVHSPIREFMKVNFRSLKTPDMRQAFALFSERGFALIPVVDDELRLQSVVTLIDCLRALPKT